MKSNDKNILDKFYDYLTIEKHKSILTVRAYRDDIEAFLETLELTPDQFDPKLVDDADIRRWLEIESVNGISARSIKRRLSSVRSLWKYLLRVGYVTKDPTQLIITPKIAKRLPNFFSEQEMEQVKQWACVDCTYEQVRDNLIIELLYQTGMRCSELANLKFKDIDLFAGEIRVFGKRKKERIIPIGKNLVYQLCEYFDVIESKLKVFSPYVVYNPKYGLQLSEREIAKIVNEYLLMLGIEKRRNPHSLRHTFATQMLNNGANLNTIKELMGHANLAATEIYTHATFQQINQAYRTAHPRQVKEN